MEVETKLAESGVLDRGQKIVQEMLLQALEVAYDWMDVIGISARGLLVASVVDREYRLARWAAKVV